MLKSIKLNNGYEMPNFGLGTWMSEPGEVEIAVKHAIDVGYKHIDCAWAYLNENEVGNALSEKFQEGKVKREDIFVTSKLWCSFHRPENVVKGLDETLSNLKLDYLDLFLIHWPVSYKFGLIFPEEEDIEQHYDYVDHVEIWKAMESLVEAKKVKSIGLSNFNIQQIQRILDNSKIKPAMLQVEVSPYHHNTELVDFCFKNGIAVTAYSSLGSFPPENAPADYPFLIKDPVVAEIAQHHNCTPAQVLISYILNRNMVCIPKSVKPARIEENYKALDVILSDEDMKKLNGITTRKQVVLPGVMMKHKEYPF